MAVQLRGSLPREVRVQSTEVVDGESESGHCRDRADLPFAKVPEREQPRCTGADNGDRDRHGVGFENLKPSTTGSSHLSRQKLSICVRELVLGQPKLPFTAIGRGP